MNNTLSNTLRQQIARGNNIWQGENMKMGERLRADQCKDTIETNCCWGEETRVIRPCVEKETELIAGVGSTIPCQSPFVSDDDSSRREFARQRHTKSGELVSSVRKMEEILLFGSDAAKDELKKSLEGDWLGGIAEILQTCRNKLTDRQMMKVREDFQK